MATWQQAINDLKKTGESEVNNLIRDIAKDLRIETPKRSGRASRSWLTHGYRLGDTDVIIENKVPYIERLNEGHSKQAPAGFVEDVIDSRVQKYNTKRKP